MKVYLLHQITALIILSLSFTSKTTPIQPDLPSTQSHLTSRPSRLAPGVAGGVDHLEVVGLGDLEHRDQGGRSSARRVGIGFDLGMDAAIRSNGSTWVRVSTSPFSECISVCGKAVFNVRVYM